MISHIFSFLFFILSPISFFTVSGKSMEPLYRQGMRLVVLKKLFCVLRVRDVIVFSLPREKKLFVKRIEKIKNDSYFVVGDNVQESTDSRIFGWIKKNNIHGKVVNIVV